MKAFNKFTLVGLLLIALSVLLSVNAHAVFIESDLHAESDCFEPGIENLKIVNNTSSDKLYILTSKGPFKFWINVNGKWIAREPLSFELKSSEEKELTAFVFPACRLSPGEYEIELSIDEGGKIEEETFTVDLTESRKIDVSIQPDTALIEQCTGSDFLVTVKNNSKVSEELKLSLEGVERQNYFVSEDSFTLKEGEEKEVLLKVVVSCSADEEDIEAKVLAGIKGTSLYGFDEFNVKIVENQANYMLEDDFVKVSDKDAPTGFFILAELENNIGLTLFAILIVIAFVFFFARSQRWIPTKEERFAEYRMEEMLLE